MEALRVRHLLICAVTMTTVAMVQACSCMRGHPHVDFCSSNFVLRGRIVSSELVYEDESPMEGEDVLTKPVRRPSMRAYKLRQMKAYKFFDETKFVVPKKRHIYTHFEESLCGIRLAINQTYLITGRIYNDLMYTGICNWVQVWDELTPQQMGFLRRGRYAANCNCQIKSCDFEGDCPSDLPPLPGTCVLDSTKEFQLGQPREDLCLKEASFCKSKGNGECAWQRSPDLKDCLKRSVEP